MSISSSPWSLHYDSSNNSYHVYGKVHGSRKESLEIAELLPWDGVDQKANAHLIANSPDMFEFVKLVARSAEVPFSLKARAEEIIRRVEKS